MLRITPFDTDSEFVIKLEGCLCGPWVSEVAVCWIEAATARPGRPIRVDLDDVSHVDNAGRELMALMYRTGVRFAAKGFFMPDIVREIAENVRKRRRS